MHQPTLPAGQRTPGEWVDIVVPAANACFFITGGCGAALAAQGPGLLALAAALLAFGGGLLVRRAVEHRRVGAARRRARPRGGAHRGGPRRGSYGHAHQQAPGLRAAAPAADRRGGVAPVHRARRVGGPPAAAGHAGGPHAPSHPQPRRARWSGRHPRPRIRLTGAARTKNPAESWRTFRGAPVGEGAGAWRRAGQPAGGCSRHGPIRRQVCTGSRPGPCRELLPPEGGQVGNPTHPSWMSHR